MSQNPFSSTNDPFSSLPNLYRSQSATPSSNVPQRMQGFEALFSRVSLEDSQRPSLPPRDIFSPTSFLQLQRDSTSLTGSQDFNNASSMTSVSSPVTLKNDVSAAATNPPAKLPKHQKFFFAAMRCLNQDGTSYLVAISSKSGERFNVNEKMLETEHQIVLGDFFLATVSPSNKLALTHFKKTQHGANLSVVVKGDLAVIENVRASLLKIDNTIVFRNQHFSDALSAKTSLPIGVYDVTLQIMAYPTPGPKGSILHFQAINPKRVAPVPAPMRPPPAVSTLQPTGNDGIVVGEGFANPSSSQQPIKNRAMVLVSYEKDGFNLHFLWMLDKKEESFFRSKQYELKKGHFFEGLFKKSVKHQWNCVKYEKPLGSLIDGGLDSNGNVVLTVTLKNYQAAGQNRKYAQAEAKFIGLILDVKSILTADCNGKNGKIRRQQQDGKDWIWVVFELLP